MAADDWYRSPVWDDAARAAFEAGLARTRDGGAEQRRIQGLTLVESTDPAAQAAGVALLERLIDAKIDRRSVAGAHEHLGRLHRERGEFEQAIHHYRRSVEAERGERNREWGCGLALAALLSAYEDGEHDDEASELLDDAIEDSAVQLALRPALQVRYLLARVAIESRAGRRNPAAAYARGALALLGHGADAELAAIANAGNAEAVSPLVDEFRGADGQVVWIWDLVRQLYDAPPRGNPLVSTPQRRIAACQDDLRAAGFPVFILATWSVKALPKPADARAAAAILLRWFEDHEQERELRTVIAGALADPRVRALAAAPLLDAYAAFHSPELADLSTPMTDDLGVQRRLKGALGSALATLARDPEFDRVADLVRDPRHGSDRVYLFWALGHVKDPRAVDLCLELLDDPEVGMPALYALSDLKSVRARPRLAALAAEPTTRKRDDASQLQAARVKVATRALDKLDRAVAAGKARP